MTGLHRHYTLLAELLKGKLTYGEYLDYTLWVLQEYFGGNDAVPADIEMSVNINPFNG